MDYSLVVNGFGNAFLQEFGFPCPRCSRMDPVANVSVSILGREVNGRIGWHALGGKKALRICGQPMGCRGRCAFPPWARNFPSERIAGTCNPVPGLFAD
jgi:hypothetical protein